MNRPTDHSDKDLAQQQTKHASQQPTHDTEHPGLREKQADDHRLRHSDRTQNAHLSASLSDRKGDRVVDQKHPDQQPHHAQHGEVQLKGADHRLDLLAALDRATYRDCRW